MCMYVYISCISFICVCVYIYDVCVYIAKPNGAGYKGG